MSSKRSQRFKPIHNIALQREDLAAQTLGKIQQELTLHHKKLAELISYYNDYVKRFSDNAEKGMSVIQVQSYQNFISKLELAITEQKQKIIRVTDACNASKVDWTSERKKAQVLEKVMQRYQKQEQQAQSKQEQRLEDEFVSNRYWHKNN